MAINFVIRKPASPADYQSLRSLLREYAEHLNHATGAAHIDLDQYERELDLLPAPYRLLLCAFAPEPAGCLLLKPIVVSVPDEVACELKRFWVRPQFRGHNLGRQLVDAALSAAKAAGFTAMYLDTVPQLMAAAHRIYAERGFLPTQRYNDNPVSGVLFFRRDL